MTASDYPINFPYGSTEAPYSVAHHHRGDDRPCPMGTPVVVGGVNIGFTGATGMVTGPHLHIQEWQNDYANTRKPQNAFAPGTVTNIDPAGTQGDGSFGKFITIQTADGWNDTYCHLSQINVSVGQVIGGEIMLSPDDVTLAFLAGFNRRATDDEVKYWTGRKFSELLQAIYNTNGDVRGAYVDKPAEHKQIADLQAKVDSLTSANLKLTDQLTAVKDQATIPSPAPSVLDPAIKAEIDNTNSIVQWIKDHWPFK